MNDPLINIQTNKAEEISNNNNSINKVNTFYLKYYPCKRSEVLVNQLLNNIEDYVFGVNSTLNRKNKLDKTKLRKCVLSFIQNINHSIKNDHDTILISLDCSYFANLHLKGLLDVCDSDESEGDYIVLTVTDMEQDYQYKFRFEGQGTLDYTNDPRWNTICRNDDDSFMFLTDEDYSGLCSFLYHLPSSDKNMLAISFGLD